VPPELAATAQGIFQGVGNSLAQVTAQALGGAVATLTSVAGLFAIAAGIGIVGAAIIGLAVRRRIAQPVPADTGKPDGGNADRRLDIA